MAGLTNLAITQAAKHAINGFKQGFPILSALSTRFDLDAGEAGDTVKVPVVDLTTTAQEQGAGGYDFKSVDATGVDVKIGTTLGVPITIADKDFSAMGKEAFGNYFEQQGMILGRAIFERLVGAIKAAVVTGATSVNGETFDATNVNEIRSLCTQGGWPLAPRNLIIDSTLVKPLFDDDAIKTASAYGDAGVIKDGSIGKLYGFDIFEVPQMPDNGEGLKGIAIHPSGIAFASKVIKPMDEAVANKVQSVQYLPDANSGLTLVYRKFYDANAKAMRTVLEIDFGFAIANAKAIRRIVGA